MDKNTSDIGTDRDASFEILAERNSRRAIAEDKSAKGAHDMRQFHRELIQNSRRIARS